MIIAVKPKEVASPDTYGAGGTGGGWHGLGAGARHIVRLAVGRHGVTVSVGICRVLELTSPYGNVCRILLKIHYLGV